ncbi:molybdopterin-dependent oxidoreductase [Burkholderia sp. FERM BP-3421]|uniref:molybdopterin-dependent oxidoreductase n=1 Tax=Burkholderia sp. FERM BP-3421 TaxID=1494466 RepID=UPI00235F4F20|nr:molybdopterin-dependent oxidoreductase [Burkholderia sp. FERM BP-3421]WDD90938.1 molybdopterin-dependent oxidoreductase [Burkholderia sp. FERM BP-3421]
MPKRRSPLFSHAGRRGFLTRALGLGLAGAAGADAWGAVERMVELPFGNGRRAVAADFPQKGALILQRTRPPLLETPFEVFDRHLFTPNDAFYVRWHMANIPTRIDPAAFRLVVHGHVERPLTLTLDTLVRDFEPVEVAAVNQCSGNSRGYYAPRVPGAQWAHGAMGNARWTGVRLKDVLERAGVRAGALRVRMNGLETPIMPDTPAFKKSLAIEHALDGEAVIAYLMNGEPLPLLNGFPLRLVVPGWYATYWVKMLSDIEVLDRPDDNYWTARAYLIPDTPGANVRPGQTGVRMVPINRMVPRSFITNPPDGARLARGASAEVRGIAFGGDCGVAGVRVSPDGGRTWLDASLDRDYGRYSFRRWRLALTPPAAGPLVLMVRATNTAGVAQPLQSNWNGSGFMRNGVESVALHVI